jgi:hypothetical protein
MAKTLHQRCFQLQKRRQQLIRLNEVAATVPAMGINDPAPAISGNGAAIAHDQPAAESLSAMISQYFIGGMMPELASPVQQPQTIIEIRPYRGGCQCFEGPGVEPYWTGENAIQNAIDYCQGREIWAGRDSRTWQRRLCRERDCV